MKASCLFQIALVAASLSLFTGCMGEDRRDPAGDTRTTVAVGAGDQVQGVAVTDGRIRLTASHTATAERHSSLTASASSAIELETIAASRGDAVLDVTALGSELSAPDVVTTVRASFVETVQNNPDGVEQSWRFERAPGKSGDLVIGIGIDDLDYLGSDDRGLQLRRAGELDVSYSHGTWIDAAGHEWAIQARYDAGRILLTVPASVVARSTYPAVLDPKIVVTPIAE